MSRWWLLFVFLSFGLTAEEPVATFSVVGRDPATGELGIAVASRFFSVGSVVPWADAKAGAVATQSFANTSFGPRGLELMRSGLTAEEALKVMLRTDDRPNRRQVGIVGSDGSSISYTGPECITWAGGRNGPNYAVQGNILAGEQVVLAMEKAFLETRGSLADRLFASLAAGDAAGGDARGRQSAALMVVKDKAGYGGYNDRAIDIRVDDHADPFAELKRLLDYAQMNYAWNEAWTLFMAGKFSDALPLQERAAKIAPGNPEVLYDLAVIRLAAGKRDSAIDALRSALTSNPKLKTQAKDDKDLAALSADPRFVELLK